MKKAYTVILILVALLAVSCATAKVEEPAAVAEEVKLTVADFADKTADATIILLANPTVSKDVRSIAQLEGANFVHQCYNAVKWYGSYDLAKILSENFWFKVAADQTVSTGSVATDGYTEEVPYSKKTDDVTVRVAVDKSLVLMKDSGDDLGYDTYVGEGQSASWAAWNQIYTSYGMEALFFAPTGLDELYLTDYVGEFTNGQHFQEAENYIIEDVKGNTYKIAAEDAEWCIVRPYLNTVNIEDGEGHVINDVYSIIPEGLTKENAVYDPKTIVRGVFAINAKTVYGEEPNTKGNYKGSYYFGITFADILDFFNVETPKAAKIQANGGSAQNFSVSDVLNQRLIHIATDNLCAVQQYQDKAQAKDIVRNVQYVTFDNALVVCGIPASVSVAELNKAAGFFTPAYAVVNYINGTSDLYEGTLATALNITAATDVASIQLYY